MEDPSGRLRELPLGWERIDKDLERDDSTLYDFFRHRDTGQVVSYDQRLEPEALSAKGVGRAELVFVDVKKKHPPPQKKPL